MQGSQLEVESCFFSGGYSDRGSAIQVGQASSLSASNSTFEDNEGDAGAVAGFYSARVVVEGSTFRNNKGLFADLSLEESSEEASITGTTFTNGTGSSVLLMRTPFTLSKSVFLNMSHSDSPALEINSCAAFTLSSNTFSSLS